MYERPRQSLLTKILDSKFFLIVSLILLILVSFALFKIIYYRIQIKKDVTSLEDKIKTLEQSNLELVHLIDYLNTDSFKEESARKELGLKKPNEKVVVITKKQSSSNQEDLSADLPAGEAGAPEETNIISNPRKWWQYFFE